MNIHLVQMSHTDLGYTDSRDRIQTAYAAFLSEALDLVEQYRSYPEGSRFRWTVETGWALQQFVKLQPDRVPELVQAVKEGFIELTGNYLHFTDLIDPHLLKESTKWLSDFLDQHGLHVRVATHNDINGFPSALPSILRESRVEFLVTGMNHTLALGLGPRHRIAQWTALDGTCIPVWYGDHYNLGNWMGLSARNIGELFGRPTWPYEGVVDRVEDLYPEAVEHTRRFTEALKERSYPWNCILIQCAGLQADNSPPGAQMCDIARRFNEERPLGSDVTLTVSSLGDFYDELRAEMTQKPDQVEDWQGAWPDYWALGLGPVPNEMKSIRRAQSLLPALQKMAGADHAGIREAVEKALLALEHTFGAYDSVMQWYGPNARQQWCLKQETFYRPEQLCDAWLENQELELTRHDPLGDQEALVLNPAALHGVHSGIIQLPERLTRDGQPCLDVNDASVPLQRLSTYDMNYGRHILGGHWLFRADLEGQTSPRVAITSHPLPAELDATPREDVLENDWVRLKLDPEEPGICELFNKQTGRNYIQPGSVPMGALIHEDHPHILRPPGPTNHENESKGVEPTISSLNPKANVHRERAIRTGPATRVCGPLFDELRMNARLATYASMELTVRLHHQTGCVELIYKGVKNWINTTNADHVFFGADFQSPRFLLETSGGLFEPDREQVPGSCLDFFTVQHCAAVHDQENALVIDPVDTPLMQIGQPTLGAWLRTLKSPEPALISNLYNNLWFTNFPTAHAGPMSARYVLRTGAFSELETHRQLTRDCAEPLLFGYAGEKRSPFPW